MRFVSVLRLITVLRIKRLEPQKEMVTMIPVLFFIMIVLIYLLLCSLSRLRGCDAERRGLRLRGCDAERLRAAAADRRRLRLLLRAAGG